MKTLVKQLVLVALALGLHSALFVEAQSFTPAATTTTTTTPSPLPPVAVNTTTATTAAPSTTAAAPSTTAAAPSTTAAAPSTTARPTREPIPLPDDVDAKGGVLQVKGMLEINGLRWLLGGDSVFDGPEETGNSVFNGAERVLPLALTLLPLLGLMF